MDLLSPYSYLAFFTSGFLLTLVLTPLVRSLALATGKVAVPRDNRWHKKETALMGGVAIFIATTSVWAGASLFAGWELFGKPFLPVLACASGIFVLGLVDDMVSLVPQHKLAVQIVIVCIFMSFGFRLEWTSFNTADLFLSILWVLGITNAFNLLDNMDGLAAGVAFIAGTFLFLTGYMSPQITSFSVPLLILCSCYLGVLLGFLFFNFNPASIFMGDAGSLFIGFIMASMTMVSGGAESVGYSIGKLLSVIAIPILILFIPILDTGFVSLMRKFFRRPISQGGKDHSSHRLVAIGFSERKAVVVLYCFSTASGLIALSVQEASIGITVVLILFYLLFVAFFWIYLARVKVYDEESVFAGSGRGAITPLVIQFTYRRRLFEVLLDFILITVAYYSSYLLRFEGPVYYMIGDDFRMFLKSLPIVLACQIFCFYILGIYRGIWEAAGISDLIDFIKAVTLGTVMSMLILLFLYRFESFSRAVFIIYWVLMLLMVSLSRLSFRLVDEGAKMGRQKGKPVLIYGAGTGGRMVAREIENNPSLGLVIKGFMDDNPRKLGKKIMGYPVLGGRDELEMFVSKMDIREIIISFKYNADDIRRSLENKFNKMDFEVKIKRMKMVLE
jgi:UDP-GlcNAc:undecaprenyl-phosphate/decaprenyl-phosphate GlcNAc-1-phosphate transferase